MVVFGLQWWVFVGEGAEAPVCAVEFYLGEWGFGGADEEECVYLEVGDGGEVGVVGRGGEGGDLFVCGWVVDAGGGG